MNSFEAKVKAAIATDPANSGKTDAEVMAWFLDAITEPGVVVDGEFAIWLAQTDGYKRLKDLAAGTDKIKRRISGAIIFRGNTTELDFSDSKINAMLAEITDSTGAAGFTAAELNTLKALGDVETQRWRTLNLPRYPLIRHISAARAV